MTNCNLDLTSASQNTVPMVTDTIGGSKRGGARGTCTPVGSKFFQFHAVFGKIWQNRMLVPPPQGWCPHLGEILDPPLDTLMDRIGSVPITTDANIQLLRAR